MRPTEEQQAAVDLFAAGSNVVVEALAGTGKTAALRFMAEIAPGRRGLYAAFNKALRADQKVATPSGWRRIGDLRVGDAVLGRDGRPHRVTKVHDRGVRPMNRVVMSDGTVVVADDEHLWAVERTHKGNSTYVVSEVLDTTAIRELIGSGHSIRLPKVEPLVLEARDLPIDPYVLGCLLGDGAFAYGAVSVTLGDRWIAEEIGRHLPPDHTIRIVPSTSERGAPRYSIVGPVEAKRAKGSNAIRVAISALELTGSTCGAKRVPEDYLWSSAAQRLALLQGLMDTDGCSGAGGGVTPIFTSTSEQLAEDVAFLARSLGGAATVRQMTSATENHAAAFQVTVRLPTGAIPFRLPRKVDSVRPRSHDRLLHRRMVNVIPAEAARAVCISIESDDHLFLTEGLVPTHNSIQLEAARRFAVTPVTARTMHSLAYAEYGAPMRHRLGKQPPLKPTEKAQILGINDKYVLTSADGDGLPGALSRQQLVSYATKTVMDFMRTMDPVVTAEHAYLPPTIEPKLKASAASRLRTTIAEFAQEYWKDLQNPSGRMKYTPEAYLKCWALSAPVLPFDYILFDEAQDADGLITAVLLAQDAQVIAVGDRRQQIYEWRGAVNAMDAFGGERTMLRRSFRFGPAIAEYANMWLEALGAPDDMRLVGSDKLATVRRRTPGSGRQPDAVLTRTNAAAIEEIVTAQEQGVDTGIAGEKKSQELRSLAQAALDLKQRGWTSHPELSVFNTWADVRAHADSDDGADMKPLVDLVDRVGADQVVAAIDACVPVDQARTTVSTAHVAKGLEWAQVHIAEDFREPPRKKGIQQPMRAEEARLAYVAATRAKRFLDPRGLEWFPRFLEAGGTVAEPSAGYAEMKEAS